ncbi:MAG: hypothetical protein BWK76_05285 [Desulfobulbaceae bacterium A2]|nr:MAG: hypothetical protein BWK76_05285 [Desulfobulbaceae bacterium A2]
MPRVSVIIPCYNQGAFVHEAIDSVLRQGWQDFEIIVVNDGSTEEESRRILAALDRPRTTVLHTDNQGLAAARNNGIRAAGGEYILPLDADDRIGPRYLEQAVAALDSRPELGIVYCRAELFGAVEGPWQLPEFSLAEMLQDNCIFCTALFRRSDWELVGGYDPSLTYGWEDYDFWLALLERGRRVLCLPETHFFYRVSEDSMVRARPLQHKVDSFAHIFRKHEALFREHIAVWIERLLQARQGGYHEAWLSGEGLERGAFHGRLVRKIEPGLRRLRFPLADLGGRPELCWHPADDWVLFHLCQARVEEEDGRVVAVPAAFRHCGELAGATLGRGPDSQVVLTLPSPFGPAAVLVLEIDYRALGADCLAYCSQHLNLFANNNHESESEVALVASVAVVQQDAASLTVTSKEHPIMTADEFSDEKRKRFLCKLVRRVRYEILLRTNAHFKLLAQSGLFIADYYRSRKQGAQSYWKNPLEYYVAQGCREEVTPHPLFDIVWYRAQHPEIGDGDPLRHYIERGWRQGANPTALFFSRWYAAHYPESTAPGWTPLRHYIEQGWRAGCRPNPLFDPAYYLATTAEARQAGIEPLEHFIYTGQCRHLRRTSPFFDEQYYLDDNASLAAACGNIVLHMHYLEFGAAEGRSPNRLFDPAWYREQQGIGTGDPAEPFIHYSTVGSRQGARPWRLFDPVFYAASSPEAAASPYPLNHYLESGVFQGAYPCAEVAALTLKPRISIITPVYDTDPLLLRKCLCSVLYQAYPHWELCLVDDASPAPHVRAILEEFAALDGRIRVSFLSENQGIAGASTHGLAMAGGDYVAFLDHDDELRLDALYEMARAINETGADFLYSDEDLVDQEGRYLESFAKPDWNPELLLCHNYITHLLVARRDLVGQVGGFAAETSGAQDYDLALKLAEAARTIHHLRQPLYRWRASATSTSIDHGQKDYADAAGRRALETALARRQLTATVEGSLWRFYYRVRRQVKHPAPVTLVTRILAADPRPRLQQLCQLSPGEDLRLLVLLRPDLPEPLRREAAALDLRLRLLVDPTPEQPARALQQAALTVTEGALALLAEEVLPVASDWIETLLEYATQAEYGMVGGRIDGSAPGVRPLSALPDLADGSPRYWAEFFREGSRHLNGLVCPQNVLALSVDLCMVRAELFQRLGGFALGDFPRVLFDADFCLRLRATGLNNVYTPHCRAERVSPATALPSMAAAEEAAELARFQARWQDLLLAGDPWYNPAALWRGGHCSETAWRAWWLGATLAAQTTPDATA